MPESSSNLAERVIRTARNHLSEWNIEAQLDGELDQEGDLCHSSDPALQGYANWARRMDSLNFDEMLKPVISFDEDGRHTSVDPILASRPDDLAATRSIISAVDYIALMENATLSIGLMMTYLPLDGEAAQQLFCLHRFDALQRLVSATDRLRAVCLHGVFGFDEKQTESFCRKFSRYENAFKIGTRSDKKTAGPIRKSAFDRDRFQGIHRRVISYIEDDNAPIIQMRRKRNVSTHFLGTHPARSVHDRAGKAHELRVPYLGSVYYSVGYAPPCRDEFGQQLDEAKSDYDHVIRFGSFVFELDNIINSGSK